MFQNSEQTIHDVLERINTDNRLLSSDIQVTMDGGKIILKGMVPTPLAKTAAEEDAYKVPEVMFVENMLDVRTANILD